MAKHNHELCPNDNYYTINQELYFEYFLKIFVKILIQKIKL